MSLDLGFDGIRHKKTQFLVKLDSKSAQLILHSDSTVVGLKP